MKSWSSEMDAKKILLLIIGAARNMAWGRWGKCFRNKATAEN